MLINLDSTTLETLLKRAASSSRLVRYLDAHAAATIVGPIAANVDKIVHALSELLGNHPLIAAPARPHTLGVAMQFTLGRAILETLLEQAMSAARLVGSIDDDGRTLAVGPLGDEIDALAHDLSELLGNPYLRVSIGPSDCSDFSIQVGPRDDVVTHDNGTELEAEGAP
jgi:hypothetical protein